MEQNDKILVFGRGQLAKFIPYYYKFNRDEVAVSDADITNPEAISAALDMYKPTVVINTAAKTSIDWCELNKEEAFKVNTLGPHYLWQECQKRGIFFVHFSSGCIYHSSTYDQIYKENDTPNPRCYYSWTKVWGDNLLGKDSNLLILRPRVVISSSVDKRNTLAKWLTYTHFIKDQNSVSVVDDFLPAMIGMVKKRISGTFNITNKGVISPYEIALLLKEEINPRLQINQTTLDEVNENLVAKRVTTVLDTSALKTVGFELPEATDSIRKAIKLMKASMETPEAKKIMEEVLAATKSKYTIKQLNPTTFVEKN